MRARAARASHGAPPLARRFAPAVCVALAVLSTIASGAAATPPNLLAHGSDERQWLVRVDKESPKSDVEVSSIFVRGESEPRWTRLEPITARVVSLGNKDSQLALLLSSGDWRLTTDNGFAAGRSLPNAARMLTLGSDGPTLWAVGLEP